MRWRTYLTALYLLTATIAHVPVARSEDQTQLQSLPAGCSEVIDVADLDEKGIRRVHGSPPKYPKAQIDRGMQGEVVLEIVIAKDGRVVDMKVVTSSGDDFTQAAIRATKDWQYTPPEVDGHPACVRTKITDHFWLE